MDAQLFSIKNPMDILNNNDFLLNANVGRLVQEGEHARMDDIQGTVGVSFFNDAGDIDFTCTCEGERKIQLAPVKDTKVGGWGSGDQQLFTHLARSSRYSRCSPRE